MTTGGVPTVVLVGNPKPRSRTYGVACATADGLRRRLAERGVETCAPDVIDLADVAANIGDPQGVHTAVSDRLHRASNARLLLVASPTFKATYSGLLKMFVDLLPRGGLEGVVTVPIMTAAVDAHRRAVEDYLKPLLVELGGIVPAPGLAVMEAEFGRIPIVLDAWCDTAVPLLVPHLDTAVHQVRGAGIHPRVPSERENLGLK